MFSVAVSFQDVVSAAAPLHFAGVLICCDVVSPEFVFNESFAQCSIINLYSVKSFIRHTCYDTSLISGVDLINGSCDVL